MSATTAADNKRILITDCEGPISKNDNAFELTKQLIPEGEKLFTLISRYDDVLADVVSRGGYKAGDTLKLILPFLKAYNANEEAIREYSSRNILLVPGAVEMLRFVRSFMPTFIVSTSYEQYMHALCHTVNFPFENVRCTRLKLDSYTISDEERGRLRELKEEMVRLPLLEIPKNAQSVVDLPSKMQKTMKRLDEIFWKLIASMEIGTVLKDVNPVGGPEKASTVKEIASKMNADLKDVMYVGDSITDVAAFRLVRDGNGLTVSFNGNNFAVREAEIAVLSESAIVTAVLADVFKRFSKRELMNLAREWKNISAIERFDLSEPLKKCFLKLCRRKPPKIELVTAQNMKELMLKSTAFRKTVRGEAIGKLG